MSSYITAELRRKVIERAKNSCEYCLIHEDEQFFAFEIDHIIAEKHGGASLADNLAYACPDCNGFKGSDIASIDWDNNEALTPLFNPRKHQWGEHFDLDIQVGQFIPLSAIGRVTIFLLQLNEADRVLDRRLLIEAGRYPFKK